MFFLLRNSIRYPLATFIFIIQRLLLKFKSRQAISGRSFYPRSIKKLIHFYNQEGLSQNKYWVLNGELVDIYREEKEFENCDGDPDYEMRTAPHRWYFLSSETINSKKKINLMLDWIQTYSLDFNKPDDNRPIERWQSYTVSERMSLTVLFLMRHRIVPQAQIISALDEFSRYLLDHLEYRGRYTGNHILNNARALYLYAQAFANSSLAVIARLIVMKEFERHIGSDNILREGSTHYHILVLKWFVEMQEMASHVNDATFINFLNDAIHKMTCGADRFLIKYQEKWHIPLIGDISPDETPQKTLENLQSVFQDKKFCPHQQSEEWHRLEYFNQTVVLRLAKNGIPKFNGHHHHDHMSFTLFDKGLPVLVDLGRYTYNSQDCLSPFGKSAQAHNTVIINGESLIEKAWFSYPRAWIDKSFKWQSYTDDGLTFLMTPKGSSAGVRNLKYNRVLKMREHDFTVEDSFCYQGNDVSVDLLWHFDSEVTVRPQGEGRYELVRHDKVFAEWLVYSPSKKMEVTLYEAHESGLGWQVLSYGKKVKATSFVQRFHIQSSTKIKNIIRWV